MKKGQKTGKTNIVTHAKLNQAKGSFKKSGILLLTDLGFVLLGGVAGAFLGRWSGVAGIGLTLAGYYNDNAIMSRTGIGMVAGGAISGITSLEGHNGRQGLIGFVEEGKNRVVAYTNLMKEKTFIDKLQSAMQKSDSAVEGLGNMPVYQESMPLAGFSNVQEALSEYKSVETKLYTDGYTLL
jgi:hypothetical protein